MQRVRIAMVIAVGLGVAWADGVQPAREPGLVAHYFCDSPNWDGSWPDSVSTPPVDPVDWTFTEYRYSRVEPVVNHEFIRRGWFSVRWTGLLDTTAGDDDRRAVSAVSAALVLSPSNPPSHEFTVRLAGGRTIGMEDIGQPTFTGYVGVATQILLSAKAVREEAEVWVDGAPYPLRVGERHDIRSPRMTVALTNAVAEGVSSSMVWRLSIAATAASVYCRPHAATVSCAVGPPDDSLTPYLFEIHADDGCRLYVDGRPVIDDWSACWEATPRAMRRSNPVLLKEGTHEITVEYFQGQSLTDGDADPMRLYWSCPAKDVPRQIIRPEHFSHAGLPAKPPAGR
jgi:hypothetical protein